MQDNTRELKNPTSKNTETNRQIENKRDDSAQEKTTSPNLLLSIVAGLFGIQSRKNQERDFKSGKISNFVVAGVLSVLFILITMFVVVNIVLSQSDLS